MQSKPNATAQGSAGSSFRSLQQAVTETELLDEALCEKFAEWLYPELDRLTESMAAFITPDSGRRNR